MDLFGTANTVSGIGNFAVIGDDNHFALDDSVFLTVTGALTAPGQVYLQTASPKGIDVGLGGSLGLFGSVGAGTFASFQAAAFNNLGTVTGQTFELAPATKLATQTLTSFGTIPNNDRIGAVTLPGASSPVTTAGSIVVGVNFGNNATILELDSLGGISEGSTIVPAAAITAASVTGQAGAMVSLTNVNTISALGSFSVGGGSFTLNDTGEIGTLSIIGPVSATGISITGGGAVSAAAGISAKTGTLRLATIGTGGILLDGGAVLTSATADLDAAGGGVTETSGVINAPTLLSSGGVTGNVALGGLNNVATLAGFAVIGGDFALSDGGNTTGLAVTGPVTALNISIRDVPQPADRERQHWRGRNGVD